MSGPGSAATYATGNSRTPSRGNSRVTSKQTSQSGNVQYPAPQYDDSLRNQYTAAPVPAQDPDRSQQYLPNQGYATSDVVDQSQGPNPVYTQPGFSSGKTDTAIQLGAYPQGMAAENPAYGMPSPSGYGQQQQGPYPPVQYGGNPQQQGYTQGQQGPLGQGAQQPHSHVQYPAVLYDQQHQNYAEHDPHTMVRPSSISAPEFRGSS